MTQLAEGWEIVARRAKNPIFQIFAALQSAFGIAEAPHAFSAVTWILRQNSTGLVRKIILIGSSAVGFVLAALWLPWQQLGPLWTTQPGQNPGSEAAWLAVFTVLASLAWTATNALSDEQEMG